MPFSPKTIEVVADWLNAARYDVCCFDVRSSETVAAAVVVVENSTFEVVVAVESVAAAAGKLMKLAAGDLWYVEA